MSAELPILLLKTKSTPNDGYDEYFSRDGGYTPRFVPVLEHRFHAENMKLVKELLSSSSSSSSSSSGNAFEGPTPRYGGMIFTSQRAVEAFAQVVENVRSERSLPPHAALLSPNIPLYTVGPATARALTSINVCGQLQPTSTLAAGKSTSQLQEQAQESFGPNIHGYESGNGAALADYILPHYNHIYKDSSPSAPPLLFLVGEQRRAIIPDTLRSGIPNSSPPLSSTSTNPSDSSSAPSSSANPDTSARVPYRAIRTDEVVVYETGVMQFFETDFTSALVDSSSPSPSSSSYPFYTSTSTSSPTSTSQTNPHTQNSLPSSRWIVVFSPTGCETMLRCLGWLDPSTGRARPDVQTPRQRRELELVSTSTSLPTTGSVKTYIATIGPTTRDFLITKFGFEPDVCADKPSPEGVHAGIRKFMEQL